MSARVERKDVIVAMGIAVKLARMYVDTTPGIDALDRVTARDMVKELAAVCERFEWLTAPKESS